MISVNGLSKRATDRQRGRANYLTSSFCFTQVYTLYIHVYMYNIIHISPASQPSKRKDHTQWIVLTSGTSTLTKSQVVGQIWMTPIYSDKLLLLLSKWCKTKEKDIPRIISFKNLFILIILCVFLKEIPIQHSGMLF